MDDESDEVMMLMNLTDYEKMLGGSRDIEKMTEEELLEKINRDIAVWRTSNEKEDGCRYCNSRVLSVDAGCTGV